VRQRNRIVEAAAILLTGLFLPMKIRPDISAPLTASLAGEARLDVGQRNVIRPPVTADRGPMAAPEIRAIDQETANAGRAHFGEGDFLLAAFCGAAAVDGGHQSFAPLPASFSRSKIPVYSTTRAKSATVSWLIVDGSGSRGCRIFGRLLPVRMVRKRGACPIRVHRAAAANGSYPPRSHA
jgi:hypothetical protein